MSVVESQKQDGKEIGGSEKKLKAEIILRLGGSPGLVVMGDNTRVQEVVGSNPGAVYLMNMTFFNID